MDIDFSQYLAGDFSVQKTLFNAYLNDGLDLKPQRRLRTLNEVLGINNNYDIYPAFMQNIRSTIQVLFAIGNGTDMANTKTHYTINEKGVVTFTDLPVISGDPNDMHLRKILPMKYIYYPDRPKETDGVYYMNARMMLAPTWYNQFFAKRCAASIYRKDGGSVIQATCFLNKFEINAAPDNNGLVGTENNTGSINEIAIYLGNATKLQTDLLKNGKRFTYHDVIQTVPIYKVSFQDITTEMLPANGVEFTFDFKIPSM